MDTSGAVGPLAPALIQASIKAMSAAAGWGSFLGGMAGFFSWCKRRTIKLAPASPGLMQGPFSPPFIRDEKVSTERSPSKSSVL